MGKYHHLYYISGSQAPSITKPGENYHLKITDAGIKLYASKIWGNTDYKIKKDFIEWRNIIGVGISHTAKNTVSIVSFIGGSDKNLESKLIIRYKQNSGDISDLLLSSTMRGSNVIEKAEKAITKQLLKQGRSAESIKIQLAMKNKASYLNQLDKLAELKEKGVLTQQEFETKKKQLLGL